MFIDIRNHLVTCGSLRYGYVMVRCMNSRAVQYVVESEKLDRHVHCTRARNLAIGFRVNNPGRDEW